MDPSQFANSLSHREQSYPKILVVDDDEVTRTLLKEVFQKLGYPVQLAASGEEAIARLKKEQFPIIISDIRMARVDGMAVLRESKKYSPPSSVILMTGFGSMERAIESIQEGAFDYLSKPFKMDELKTIVSRAAKHWESMHDTKHTLLHKSLNSHDSKIIGRSPKIVEVYKTLARAAMSSSTVLIKGESGTGKELVARAIHDNSPRRGKPFVAINCGALAEGLLESELFGHVKGAFTGAMNDKKGIFEAADGGTLFLDEIGDVPPSLQVKLLRVLQENEFKPVGAVDARRCNVRVIGATHRDLEALVRSDKFREDLYYRLKVVLIDLPSLRDRMEDLPLLVEFFLSKYAGKNKKLVSHVSEEAMDRLKQYAWPGNIRELEHALERAVTMTNTTILFPEDFPSEIIKGPTPDCNSYNSKNNDKAADETRTSLEDLERSHIIKILIESNFNKSKASELLGIDRATLYRKVQRYGIDLRGKE